MPVPGRGSVVRENLTFVSGYNQSNVSFTNVSVKVFSSGVSPHMNYSFLLVYVVLFLSFVLIVLVIIMYYSGRGREGVGLNIFIGGEKGFHRFPRLNYVYDGVKAVLRKYFLELRNKLGYRNCTPRELYISTRIKELEDFAEVYEDIVYGSKIRKDYTRVISMVRKLVGGK